MKDRTPQTPPPIAPLPKGLTRPLWSVMIPTYNCIQYVTSTLQSVLQQDPGPEKMQSEVIDDCSTDGDMETLVKTIGKGRVGFYRQEKISGSLRNFETCINRAKGQLVHLLHGDDMVKDGFYKEVESLFAAHPQIGAAFTKYTYIDAHGNETEPGEDDLPKESGIIDTWLYRIAERQQLQAPAMVVKRSVYEQLGRFFAVHYGEDWEMRIRIAKHYPVAYLPKCLALYPGGDSHIKNITGRSISTGQNIKDVMRVLEIAKSYLPEQQRNGITKKARKHFSIHYAKATHRIYKYNQQAAFVQAKGAWRLHKNKRTIFYVAKLYATHALHKVASVFSF